MSSQSRPELRLPWMWPERLLATAGAVASVVLGGVTARAWPQLPEVIPTHFGHTGKPDGWGGRWLILLLPFVGTALFAALVGLARTPRSYNYPCAITSENAARQCLLARRFVLAFGILLPVIFLRLVLGVVAVALGRSDGLGRWTLIGDLIPMGLLLGAYCVMAWHRR